MIKVHMTHFTNLCIEKWLFDNFSKDDYQYVEDGYFVNINFKSALAESFFTLRFGNLGKRGFYSSDNIKELLFQILEKQITK